MCDKFMKAQILNVTRSILRVQSLFRMIGVSIISQLKQYNYSKNITFVVSYYKLSHKPMSHLKTLVQNFINSHYTSEGPILVGLSGGADSLCLLHLLLECKIPLHVAHVNHNWRIESTSEAEQLKGICTCLHLPFHKKELDPLTLTGNLEAACRQERLRFFKALCQEHGCQAVVLGHHQNDHAETILKQLFEGAPLAYMQGIQAVNIIDELSIWRPLLSVSKKEIIAWLQERNLTWFEDCTNYDSRYFRGKCRTAIIPNLAEQFGKEISGRLGAVARQAASLANYLDEKIAPYAANALSGPFGIMYDFSSSMPHPLELQHLLLTIGAPHKMSESIKASLEQWLLKGVANKHIAMGKQRYVVDRKRLFVLNEREVEWKLENAVTEASVTSWLQVWQGFGHVRLPEGNYQLAFASPALSYRGSITLDKWWNNHKIPAHLRQRVPVLLHEGQVVHEFLTGCQKVKGPIGYRLQIVT